MPIQNRDEPFPKRNVIVPDLSYQEQLAQHVATFNAEVPPAGLVSASEEKVEIFQAKNNEETTESETKYILDELAEQTKEDMKSDRGLRVTLANDILRLTKIWVWAVIGIVLLNGFGPTIHFNSLCIYFITVNPFHVPDAVLIAFISATGVFAIIAIVLKGLFRDKTSSK